MLRSKYFWLAVVLLVIFSIIWATEGFGWAIATVVGMGFVFLILNAMGSGSRRRRRYYHYDDDDDCDEEIHVTRRQADRRSDIQRGLDWHVPKVNRRGVEFITGSSSMRRRQQEDMRRIRKNLWGR